MELLAPAGSLASLRAAIAGGADAVYMGGRSFSARQHAVNFDDRQLAEAISLAHESGVRAYIAVNTLIKDGEMPAAVSFVKRLESMGADAVILQDIGLLRSIRDLGIAKHASTQMGIHSRDGLLWAAENGIGRVILARELSLGELSLLADGSPVELEVFVHGALCYSVSGQCLLSSMAGGRSGNRGACAQPCRKPYSMAGREGYLLSCKDLNCLDLLPELESMGIASVKLEGRMRGSAYTGIASSSYATALRNMREGRELLGEEERRDLGTVFNRGMGTGHLRHPEPLVNALYADNRGLHLGTVMLKDGFMEAPPGAVGHGDGIALYRGARKAGGLRAEGEGPWKLPFRLPDGEYEAYRNGSLRISSWREDEGESRGRPLPVPREDRWRPGPGRGSRAELSFYVSSIHCLREVLPYAGQVHYELGPSLPEAVDACEDAGVPVSAILPRFDPLGDASPPEMPLTINTLGQYQRHRGLRLFASRHLNMFNSRFPLEVHQATISPELSRGEVARLRRSYPGRLEHLAFGRLEVMLARDPEMVGGSLQDEAGRRFPVHQDDRGMSHIMNSADLMLLEQAPELDAMGIDSLGIDLRRRPPSLASLVARAFHERDPRRSREIRSACGQVTHGHYLRGV